MSRVPPKRGLALVFFLEIVGPKDLAVLRIEAEQVAFGAQRIDLAVFHGGRRARSERIRNPVRAVVFMLPEYLAVGLVQTDHAFAAADLAMLKRVGRIVRA